MTKGFQFEKALFLLEGSLQSSAHLEKFINKDYTELHSLVGNNPRNRKTKTRKRQVIKINVSSAATSLKTS